MKSIKPGRGPSMMGGVMGIVVAVFGVFWTCMALYIGAGPFALFGVVFVAIAVCSTVYNFKNATGENRYSLYDITEDGEETDPLNERFGKTASVPSSFSAKESTNRFCPYCGSELQSDFVYCNSCGKKLP